MTHEQKPKSAAEFRTLETQVSECARDLHASLIALEEKLYVEFAEAEARGAAEQRRKDAEGAEPDGWQYQDVYGDWHPILKGSPDWYVANGADVRPLYTRPANVAALEARVKELVGEVERLKKPQWFGVDEDSYSSPHEALEYLEIEPLQILEMMGFAATGPVWAFHDRKRSHRFASEAEARNAAAAIREGGEHG